jgi:CRISPR/Cas system type I-B associated protein Csh2 (Cas7 group RAMP superfamily)
MGACVNNKMRHFYVLFSHTSKLQYVSKATIRLTYDLNVYVRADTVKYADDLVLLAKEEKVLQDMIDNP